MEDFGTERERRKRKIWVFGKRFGIKLSGEKMIDETLGPISEFFFSKFGYSLCLSMHYVHYLNRLKMFDGFFLNILILLFKFFWSNMMLKLMFNSFNKQKTAIQLFSSCLNNVQIWLQQFSLTSNWNRTLFYKLLELYSESHTHHW